MLHHSILKIWVDPLVLRAFHWQGCFSSSGHPFTLLFGNNPDYCLSLVTSLGVFSCKLTCASLYVYLFIYTHMLTILLEFCDNEVVLRSCDTCLRRTIDLGDFFTLNWTIAAVTSYFWALCGPNLQDLLPGLKEMSGWALMHVTYRCVQLMWAGCASA